MHIIELLCAINVILVLSRSLLCQLSFDTLLYMFIVCVIIRCVFRSFFTFRGVKSEISSLTIAVIELDSLSTNVHN